MRKLLLHSNVRSILLCSLIAIITCIIFVVYDKYAEKNMNQSYAAEVESSDVEIADNLNEMLMESEELNADNSEPQQTDEQTDMVAETEQTEENTETTNDTEDIPVHEPLSNESIHISDVFAKEAEDVKLVSYVPEEGVSYKWEKFDILTRLWTEVESEMGYDDLYRNISYIMFKAKNDDIYRCTISVPDKDDITDYSRVKCLSHIVDFTLPENIEFNADSYMSICDIPIKVKFEDGNEQDIQGLNGLYFVDSVESDPVYETGPNGEIIKTVTVTSTYRQNTYVCNDNQDVKLAYMSDNKEFDLNILGSDKEAPIINKVTIDYETSNSDKAVDVKVTIDALDNITLLPNLMYALVKKDNKVPDSAWVKDMSFTKSVGSNGTYVVYVKDEAGNINTYEEDIIVIDNKKPTLNGISLSSIGWCPTEEIIVDATDGSKLTYRYNLKDGNDDSGFIESSRYEIKQNGIYEITLKDSGGNLEYGTIEVKNIDNSMPTINKIITEGE